MKTGCKTFHICAEDVMASGPSGLKASMITCPVGTLFSQINTVCQWAEDVDCNNSERFYPQLPKKTTGADDNGSINTLVTSIPFRTQIPKPLQPHVQDPSPALGSLDAGRSLQRDFNTAAATQFANRNDMQQQQVRPSLFRPMDRLVNPQ